MTNTIRQAEELKGKLERDCDRLGREMNDLVGVVLMNAWDNAQGEQDMLRVFVGSIETITTDRDCPKKVVEWFAKRGIRG